MDEVQRKWFIKGIETSQRIAEKSDPDFVRLLLSLVSQYIDDVAGDFDVDRFVESIYRRVKKGNRVLPPVCDLQKVAVGLLIAATMIDNQRNVVGKKISQSVGQRDEITNVTDMIRETALDLAGIPYIIHDCQEDKMLDENGDCEYCRNNNVKSFKDTFHRDYITNEFANLDSGDSTAIGNALQRLRNRFAV